MHMFMFIVQISMWAQLTVQFTTQILEHTLLSLNSYAENSAFGHFAIANHYNLDFLVPPGTHYC